MSSENPTGPAPVEGNSLPPTEGEPGSAPPAVNGAAGQGNGAPSEAAPNEGTRAIEDPTAPPVSTEATEAAEPGDDPHPVVASSDDEEAGEGDEAEHAPMQVPPGRPASVSAVLIPLALIDDDTTFRLGDDSDVAGLATSIARVGQYVPIEVRPHAGRMQVVSGFRRLAAVRLLHREQVLARVHEGLTDADALVLALAHGLEQRGLTPEQIEALRDRLEGQGSLTAQAKGLIEAALVTPGSDLEPEGGGDRDEVDLDELAADLERRLSGISSDLSAIAELWDEMDDAPRAALLDQLRYYAELHAFYARRR